MILAVGVGVVLRCEIAFDGFLGVVRVDSG